LGEGWGEATSIDNFKIFILVSELATFPQPSPIAERGQNKSSLGII